jgi:hypothetical protein
MEMEKTFSPRLALTIRNGAILVLSVTTGNIPNGGVIVSPVVAQTKSAK